MQTGLARSSVGTDCAGLAPLNRKIVEALARGTTGSVEMFKMTSKGLTRLLRDSKDPPSAHRYHQFHNQAWPMVEYLCGELAPDDRRAAHGSFLRDPRSKTAPEESFRLHFGASFAPSLDGWRKWVIDRGIGTY